MQELRDLVKRLLTHSPTQRLGSLKGGAADVKSHPWFLDFDWSAFESQTMPAPYIPKARPTWHFLSSSCVCCSNAGIFPHALDDLCIVWYIWLHMQ